MTAASPQRTIALLVGVERYATTAGWSLDGPAVDASRFARWLLDCQVPADNITLLASPLPHNEPAVAEVGLPVRPADSVTVRDVLTRQLRTQPCDLFFAYWGGHGVVAARETRRLFYADADDADKRNLNLTALIESLSSAFFPAHRDQLLLVDACQNLVSELRLLHSLPGESFPVGPPVAQRELDVILAASPGEVASNVDSRRTGLFSEVVLDLLRAGGWPPRPAALAEQVREAFTQRRAAGLARQTPAHLWRRSREQEWMVSIGQQRAATARLSITAVGRIAEAMLDLAELSDPVNRLEIIQFLPADIRSHVPYAPRARMHVIQLIRSCERFTQGRQQLVEVLHLGVSDREGLQRVLAVLDSEWPGHPTG